MADDFERELMRVLARIGELRRFKPATDDEARARSCELMRQLKLAASLRTAADMTRLAKPSSNDAPDEPRPAVAVPIGQRRAPAGKTERRAIAVAELRTKGRRLEGYAAVFGAEARIADFTETIAPGAFASTLAERTDILALVDHDPGRILARTKSGTLRLAEDARGLAFDLDVPGTTLGNDVLALCERGDLGGMSFSFSVKSEKWDGERRTLESVNLHEVSVVSAWPAYDGTIVQARSRPVFHPRVAVARRYLETL